MIINKLETWRLAEKAVFVAIRNLLRLLFAAVTRNSIRANVAIRLLFAPMAGGYLAAFLRPPLPASRRSFTLYILMG